MPILAGYLVPHPPLIVPAVGKGREDGIAATTESYHRIAGQIAALEPETVVILSPHATVYADYFHISPGKGAQGSLASFGATAVTRVDYDRELTAALSALCEEEEFPAGTLGERHPELDHGTLIPLHFLAQAGSGCRVVRVAPSGLGREIHYRFGALLARAVEVTGRRVVVIASGDLSHKLTADGPYGFVPEGPALDKQLTDLLAAGRLDGLLDLPEDLCARGAECGLRPLLMLAGALDGLAIAACLHSYEGPFGVGYAVAGFPVTGPDSARRFLERRAAARRREESAHVRLARATLESYVHTAHTPPLPSDLPDELTGRRAGVFVSIKKRGELRGCIGTIEPTRASVAEEIQENAVAAGTRDPRFPPIGAEELDQLAYSVDVLAPPEPAELSMLDPERYGVIVDRGHRRGLLLPRLEGVDSVEEQVAIARRKAGIGPEEPCAYQRFEVVRYT